MWRVGCVPGASPEPRHNELARSLAGALPEPRRSLAGASPEPRQSLARSLAYRRSPEPRQSLAFKNTYFWYILASGVSVIF